jgi:hypothetical protein
MITIRAFQARPGDLLDGESAREVARTETWRLVESSDPAVNAFDEITLTDVDGKTYTFGANEDIEVLRPAADTVRR